MTLLKLEFMEKIGRGNTEMDVLNGQIHLDIVRALSRHEESCKDCRKKEAA